MSTNSGDAWDFISSAPDFHVAMIPLLDLISFIQAMHEFLPYIASQQSIRVHAIINKENDPVAIGECGGELEEIIRRDKEIWPQIVWGSVLVSIYAAFEHGVEQVFKNWRSVFNTDPAFSQKQRQDFLAAAEEYATAQIKISLFSDKAHQRSMINLKELRNSYVHNGCRFSLLPQRVQTALTENKYIGCQIIGENEDAKWIADARTCLFFALQAKNIVRLLGDTAFRAYELRLN